MSFKILAPALGLLLMAGTASAQETTVIRKETTTTTEVPAPAPDVTVRTQIEETGSVAEPCQTTTVKKDDGMGNSKTVKRTDC
jgi:hypothetical protein